MNERERALALLRRIDRESAYASLLLRDESGAVRTLVLGVLRWRSQLDAAVARHAKRKVDAMVADVLRLGAFQLLHTDTAAHAAVGETVALAPKHARGFANAVLRKIAADRTFEPQDLATRTAHPEWLIERWRRNYGEERATRIAEADQQLSFPDVLALGEASPPDAEPSRLVPAVWKLRGSSAALDRESFWPMDEGSAVIAAIAANAGRQVLDLAAAPGSKSLYLARMGRDVFSNDVSIGRLLPLRRYGGRIVVSDARTPPFGKAFEVVLLDAPCSATGTIRKNPELKWRLQESDLAGFAELQSELLRSALSLTRSACVYSTCSLEPEENDAVVQSSGAEVVDITAYVPEGATAWVEAGVLRLTPDSGADGFTAFLLRPR